jgi:hypothetical protein
VEQELESDGTTSTVTKAWTYDADQRLTSESVTVSGSVNYNSFVDTYTLDLVGNRIGRVAAVRTPHLCEGPGCGVPVAESSKPQPAG